MDEQDWDETEQIPTREGYVRESGYARRQRLRQRRTFVTLGLVVLALFFAFWYALSYYTANKDVPAPRQTCVTPTVALPPSKVKVNVYNATTRTGLAAATAKILGDRGFVVGKVDNDPLQKSVKGAAELRFGPAGKGAANVVYRHLTSAKLVQDKRKDATVDVVLGNAWKALGKVPPGPTPTCR
jgi:hypothetical protein